jgi:lipopolysaccharide export system protein LptA
MTGRAKGIVYSESAGEIRLGGGFEAVLAAPGGRGQPIVLSGASLTYRSVDRRGRVDGQAAFSDGRIKGSSHSLSFTAAGDESALVSALFEGRARVVLTGADRSGRESGAIDADRVEVSFRRGLVSSAEAAGAVVFSLRPAAGPAIRVRAGKAEFAVGPDGAPGDWAASGGVAAEIGPGGDEGITAIESDSAEFTVATGILRAGGQAGRPAVAESAGIRIEAPRFAAGPAAGDLAASQGVRCVFKPGAGDRTAGFFSAGEEAFVTADSLVRKDGEGTVTFAGTVRAWQGGESVRAGELEISGAGEGMRAGGGVSAGLVLPAAAAGPERRVEIGGGTMVFSAAGRALSFEGRSYVQLSGARLEARSVAAVLAPGARAVVSLSARTDVVLSKGRYEGRGAAAAYEAASDRLVLTGKPVLTDGKGAAARGDKLTFDLADDKILLENEGQGRTTTVVKS